MEWVGLLRRCCDSSEYQQYQEATVEEELEVYEEDVVEETEEVVYEEEQ